MLEIDYSLIPLTEADQALLREEVSRKIKEGNVPKPDRSVDGRIVVLNPDLVQTAHQITDDLRPRLRRIMLPAQRGSTHLPALELFTTISESDERLYILIIELQSDFRFFSDFLDFIPRLRRENPEMTVFLSGSMTHLREKFHQILSAGGASLVVEYAGEMETVEISDPEVFIERVTTQEQEISLSIPFFTEVRLLLVKGGKPISFNLVTLRKLHSVLGHGEAKEVEVGRGRKERMIVIDLPVPLIHDFRFRQDRGLEFLGAVINGDKIFSRHFSDEKLEFRWIPLKNVDAFIRRNRAGEEEEILMDQVRVLRVNTLTGQISFIMKEEEQRVSLDQAASLGFRKKLKGEAIKGLGIQNQEEVLINFDRFIQPGNYTAQETLVQESVKSHFYQKLIGEGIEHDRKLEIYAQRLKVGAVGPLAGQTLKLLRRFGLERLIDPEYFYYLCDTPEDLLDFRNTAKRYEEHFQNLVTVIGELAVGKPTENIRISDIAFNLPISTEWVDTGLAKFAVITHQDLEAVFHEMNLLSNFIAHEFRRNFDLQEEDVIFFEKIDQCREAGLLAKWLAEYKRGAYGEPMPDDVQPDMLFFATTEDKKENDKRYFFPSMSCTELFRDPANQKLFDEFDFSFSVFLEEQLALAVHHARENGALKPGPEDFDAYFTERKQENDKELGGLNVMLDAIENTGSDTHQKMLAQEEENYRERFKSFQQDREKAEALFKNISQKLDALLEGLKPEFDRAGAAEVDFYLKDPERPEAREHRMLEATERVEIQHSEILKRRFQEMRDVITGWIRILEEAGSTLVEIHKLDTSRHNADKQNQMAGLQPEWEVKRSERTEVLLKMKPMERNHHGKRVENQIENFQGEIEKIKKSLSQFDEKHQRALGILKHYIAHAGARLGSLGEDESLEDPKVVVAQAEMLRKTLGKISDNALNLAARSEKLQENLEKARQRYLREMKQIQHLKMESLLLQAISKNTEPPESPFALPEGGPVAKEKIVSLREEWKQKRASLGQFAQSLKTSSADLEGTLKAVKGQAATLLRFKGQREDLIRLTARKRRLRESTIALAERKTIMEEEMADLPGRVKRLFMPARKKLLVDVFIPEQEEKIQNFEKVQGFLNDLMGLPFERLKERYLDHAIFRRFYSRQFYRGGVYAADQSSPRQNAMRNVAPGLKVLNKGITHNFKLNGIPGVDKVTFSQLKYQNPQSILEAIERMAKSSRPLQFDFMVLPPTFSLMEGLNIINRKDAWFHGVPRLMLIFISKFDRKLLRDDQAVRDAYFKAVKHNIVINIDGHAVVDNQRSIGVRLVQETVGCAIDIENVEDPPDMAFSASGE